MYQQGIKYHGKNTRHTRSSLGNLRHRYAGSQLSVGSTPKPQTRFPEQTHAELISA